MIHIKRDNICPEVKDRHGNCKITEALNGLKTKYSSNPADCISGVEKMTFDNDIYGHPDIKAKLIKTQYGKCAFCESNIISVAYGDIEHFRPKGGIKQNTKSRMINPGYYWLAYDWNNLMFACGICNQMYKKNLFPLRNPEVRALNHTQFDRIKREKPFFINPIKENPRLLIQFRGATAIGIDKNHRGKKTIEALGLNRKGNDGISDLYEMRLNLYSIAELHYRIATSSPNGLINQGIIDDSKKLIQEMRSSKRQYSAMIRDNFPI